MSPDPTSTDVPDPGARGVPGSARPPETIAPVDSPATSPAGAVRHAATRIRAAAARLLLRPKARWIHRLETLGRPASEWVMRGVFAVAGRLAPHPPPPARDPVPARGSDPTGARRSPGPQGVRPAPAPEGYQLYLRGRGRPYLALRPRGASALAALGAVCSASVRRRMLLTSIAVSTTTGAPVLLRRRAVTDPLLPWCGVGLSELCQAVDEALAAGRVRGLVDHSAAPDQVTPQMVDTVEWSLLRERPRAYLRLSEPHGARRWFVKLRLPHRGGPVDDHFARERCALLHLGGRFHGCAVPTYVAHGRISTVEFIATTAIPGPLSGSWALPRPLRAALLADARHAPLEPFPRLRERGWWQRWESDVPGAMVDRVSAHLEPGCRVGFVHGDLTVVNVVHSRTGPWVVDWEFSDDAGPAWVDLVAAEVCSGGPVIRDPAASRAVVRHGASVADVVASVVYMASHGQALARQVLAVAWGS